SPGRSDSIFFSSRRRHTRSKRDWSSDVCSSDLSTPRTSTPGSASWRRTRTWRATFFEGRFFSAPLQDISCKGSRVPGSARGRARSEERRVGKEWRARGAEQDEKKKRS